MKSHGFVPQLEIRPQSSNLFYYYNKQRILLMRENGCFVAKNGELTMEDMFFYLDEKLQNWLAQREPFTTT
jgi:uncharacterized protein YllA (UPF0747 family)